MQEYIDEKERKVIDYIKENPHAFIHEIAEATYISRSSVQRYLEKYKNIIIPRTRLTIEEQMKVNQLLGRRKGGLSSFQKNTSIKDEEGHFQGCVKDNNQEKEFKKRQDIIMICNYYLANYPKTLVEISKELEDTGIYTKSYIYRCLTDPRVVELLGVEKAKELSLKLKTSRQALSRKRKGLDDFVKKLKGYHD